jgi:hypothetical protein
VRALDTDGTVLATGSLVALPAPTDAQGGIPDAERRRCVWSFSLPGLPPRERYAISIGDRGSVDYSRTDLEAAGWNVDVALGG